MSDEDQDIAAKVLWLTFDEPGHIAFMREFNDTAALAEAFDR